jgi:hypothetical protein
LTPTALLAMLDSSSHGLRRTWNYLIMQLQQPFDNRR